MTETTLDRAAVTDADLAPQLSGRWSPRAFDADHTLSDEQLTTLLEAARWAPSANNHQPWRFAVTRRGTALWQQVFDTLIGFNKEWAGAASALIVNIAETQTAEGESRRTAQYDLGQAVAHLTVQAQHDGLLVHQMTGFDADAAAHALNLPSNLVPFSLSAIGVAASPAILNETLAAREVAPRLRRPLAESLVTFE